MIRFFAIAFVLLFVVIYLLLTLSDWVRRQR